MDKNNFQSRETDDLICEAFYSSTDEALTLHSDRKGWHDAAATYRINKDGSGQKTTAWGSKKFPEGTFAEIWNDPQFSYPNESKHVFSEQTSRLLLEKIIQKIKNKTFL